MNPTTPFPDDRPFDYSLKLACLTGALHDALWPPRGYDARLRERLDDCFDLLYVRGIRAVAFICQYDRREVLFHVSRRLKGADLAERVAKIDRQHLEQPGEALPLGGEYWTVRVQIPELADDGDSDDCSKTCSPHFGALVYRISRSLPLPEVVQWNYMMQKSVIPMLFQVFRSRERWMMPFAPGISRHYWECSREQMRTPLPNGRTAPWNYRGSALRSTVTLSIDLRKSTFCMSQSVVRKEFAEWLDQMVQDMIRVCHDHGGVFDKFTGDGGLMHFLEEECQAVFREPAIVLATRCASELRAAVAALLPVLRRNLRNDSNLLGAGIGAGMGDATWSVDHRGNPIVVGDGVVDACRICDTAPARSIRISNYAHAQLGKVDGGLAGLFERIPLPETKDLSPTLQVVVWESRGG